MASVAIPLVVTALGTWGPIIGKLGSSLINLAEAFLPSGKKMPAVVSGLQSFLQTMGEAGQLPQSGGPSTMPTAAQLELALEGVLAKMKNDGTLVPALIGVTQTPTAPVSGSGQPGFAAAFVQWAVTQGYLK